MDAENPTNKFSALLVLSYQEQAVYSNNLIGPAHLLTSQALTPYPLSPPSLHLAPHSHRLLYSPEISANPDSQVISVSLIFSSTFNLLKTCFHYFPIMEVQPPDYITSGY